MYPIGINNHASQCMANAPHLFEDLCLARDRGQVDKIGDGLEINAREHSNSQFKMIKERSTQ
jgi:hypothetical protein